MGLCGMENLTGQAIISESRLFEYHPFGTRFSLSDKSNIGKQGGLMGFDGIATIANLTLT